MENSFECDLRMCFEGGQSCVIGKVQAILTRAILSLYHKQDKLFDLSTTRCLDVKLFRIVLITKQTLQLIFF
jgi:hypothetical protein